MFGNASLDYLLSSSTSDITTKTKMTAGMQGNNLVIKIAHYDATQVALQITLNGFGAIPMRSSYALLTSQQGADAQNTLDNPNNVKTVQGFITTATQFAVKVVPWSIHTITIPLS